MQKRAKTFKNMHLEYFWTQFKNVHLQGPCSLRLCCSRTYCISIWLCNTVLHKWVHTKCHSSISVHLTTKPKPVSCLAFQIFHICKVYFNLPAVVSNFPLGKMPCSPAIVSQNWKSKRGIGRYEIWKCCVKSFFVAQESLSKVSVVPNLHSFRRVNWRFLSTSSVSAKSQ